VRPNLLPFDSRDESTFVGYPCGRQFTTGNAGGDVIEERVDEHLRPAVEKVRRLRMRASVLSFVGAIASALLPVSGSLALFEEAFAAEAAIATGALGAASAGAFVVANRGRKQARRIEQDIEAQLGEPPQ
jgi:hypothetical protein